MALVLDEPTVAQLLRMEELIDLMEGTLAEFSSGRAVQPVRAILSLERHGSFMGVMPGYLSTADALAVKLVCLVPRNADRGMPTHLATIVLMNPETGETLAIMDGRLITEMRTAAVSAAAARRLARRETPVLAILGSGVQAKSHLDAMRAVRTLGEVRVHSPNAAHRERFALEASSELGIPVRAMESAEAAVRGADLVVTATASRTPVVHGAWIEPGCHVTAVGACLRDWRELDGQAVAGARVFVDSRDAARVEAGDLILAEREGAISPDHVAGEIGAVFAGALGGRTDDRQVTLFKSLGLAVEDVATARHVFERARARGVGTEVAL
jgi:alanine dehydrogenase